MVIFNSFFDITRGYHIMIIGFTTLWTKHDPGLPGRFFAASFLQRGDQRAWEDQDGSLHVHPPKCSIISFNPYHIQIIYLNICIYKYNTLFYIIVYFFYFTILYYIILYYTILYYIILYFYTLISPYLLQQETSWSFWVSRRFHPLASHSSKQFTPARAIQSETTWRFP